MRSIRASAHWKTASRSRSAGPLFSANAYLGVEEMLPCLASGADIVLTGRVAILARAQALAHHFGWTLDDEERWRAGLWWGICSNAPGSSPAAISRPGQEGRAGMASLGFPFADVDADGTRGCQGRRHGGLINRMTGRATSL